MYDMKKGFKQWGKSIKIQHQVTLEDGRVIAYDTSCALAKINPGQDNKFLTLQFKGCGRRLWMQWSLWRDVNFSYVARTHKFSKQNLQVLTNRITNCVKQKVLQKPGKFSLI